MIWKKTVVMTSAFIICLGAALIARLAASGGSGPVFEMPAISADAISRIEIAGGEHPVELEKRGEDWVVLPGEHAADQRALERLTKSIAEIEVGSMRSNNPEKYDLYQVAEGNLKVSVFTGADSTFAFFIGKETGDRKGDYIRRVGRDEVFATSGRIRMQFEKEMKLWRDRTIASFSHQNAERLVISKAGKSLSFVKGEKEWEFSEIPADLPENFRLDESKVSEAVRTLSALRAAEFVDDAGDPTGLGLSPHFIEVVASLKGTDEAAGEEYTLLIGGEKEDKYYAKTSGGEQVYLINKYHYDKFARSLDDFRNLRVNPFESRDARRIEVRVGQRETVFVLDDEKEEWKLESTTEETPDGFKFDPMKIRQMATMIGNFQSTRFVGKGLTAKYGLKNPSGILTVTLADGSVHRLTIGGPAGEEELYITGDDGLVYAVKMQTAENLTRTLDQYQASSGRSDPTLSPDMLKNLPPEIRDQFLQQQRQKLFQQQMMQQMQKKRERQEKKEGKEKEVRPEP